MVSFGYNFVCNADLLEKFKSGAPLNGLKYVKEKSQIWEYLYGQSPVGYVDTSIFEPPK